MRSSSRLGTFFTATVLASLAAAPHFACGGSTSSTNEQPLPLGDSGVADSATTADGGSVDAGPLEAPFTCTNGDQTAGLEALRVALGLDYLEVRTQRTSSADAADDEIRPGSPSAGTRCATATNAAACEAAIASARSRAGLFPGCGGCEPTSSYLVHSKGDTVGITATKAELKTLLGPIDSAAKAWILARTSGFNIECSAPWVRPESGSYVIKSTVMISDCPMQYADVLLRVDADGSITEIERVVQPHTGACAGRRPEGLTERGGNETGDRTAMGAYFGSMAYLEAASITAFQILHDELASHGAPRALLHRAKRAAGDEVRHASTMARIATRFGASVTRPTVPRGPVRSLLAIALENAREGCVREAYGALEATFQAHTAEDPEIRGAMITIAKDETEHAELSVAVAAWLDERLTSAERAEVAAARLDELERLSAELSRATSSRALERAAGRPSPARARELLSALRQVIVPGGPRTLN